LCHSAVVNERGVSMSSRPKFEERTYNNPGFCIKCDGEEVMLSWETVAVEGHGITIGHLEARCRSCYYTWTVTAKDEIDAGIRFGTRASKV